MGTRRDATRAETDEAEVSDAEAALLGLLCEGPMHPWQIEKTVQERDMRFWTDLSQSTIYKQLRLLESSRLVECRQEIEGGRLRKIYSITSAGRQALATRVRQLLLEPQHLKYRVDLGTYNLHLLSRKEVLSCLRTYRHKLEEGIECYRRLDDYLVSCGCLSHRRAIARRPVYLLEGELRWVDELMAEVRRGGQS